MTQAQAENVTMIDGTVVEFAGKRKMLKSTIIGADGSVAVRLDFRNGQFRLFTIPATLLLKFAGHGAEQKLGDEIAGVDDVEDCVLAIDELVDRLNDGEWGVKREANALSGTSILLRALAEVYTNKTPEELKTWLKSKTQGDKNALRANPKIKPIIERLEAEKASKGTKVDTDALLGELG